MTAALSFGLLGSAFALGDRWPSVQVVFNRLSRFGAIEKAYAELTTLDEKDTANNPVGILRKGQTGFPQLLQLLTERLPALRQAQVSAIGYARPMTIGSVTVNDVISVAREGSSVLESVATREALDAWVQSARLRFDLLAGFVLVGLAFLLNLIAHIIGSRPHRDIAPASLSHSDAAGPASPNAPALDAPTPLSAEEAPRNSGT